MKKQLLALTIVLFLSCSSRQSITGKGDDNKISFQFVQLNDVYEIAPLSSNVGGMARVAQLVNDLKKQNPNTFLFMAGDFLNPSLLGNLRFEGRRIRGLQMIEVMNAMSFDLVTFGNHEFDLSKNELQQRLNESKFAWTSANVNQKVCGNLYPFYSEKDSVKNFVSYTHRFPIKDTDGTAITLGFFGLCIDSNPQNYVHYAPYFPAGLKAYKKLQPESDLVFGLTHLEIVQDKKLAAALQNVPLIMGGHEHNNMHVPVGQTVITKADANAKTVYLHKMTYNKNSGTLDLHSELMAVDSTISFDPKVQKIVEKWNAVLEKQIEQITPQPYELIYTTTDPLDGRDDPNRATQTNLGGFITAAMTRAYRGKVQGALVNGGSFRLDDQLTGQITALDIFRVLPFGGGIVKVELKGSLLKRVLDYGRDATGTGAYLHRHNFSTENGLWKLNDQLINNDETYSIAFSDYLLKGHDIPFLKPENPEVLDVFKPYDRHPAADIRKAVIDYLKNLD